MGNTSAGDELDIDLQDTPVDEDIPPDTGEATSSKDGAPE